MKAIQIQDYGDAGALVLADAAMPVAGPGQVLVRVAAASVNPFDIKVRAGWLRGFFPLPMPHTLGTDFAGQVVEVGAGVDKLQVGQRVFGMLTPMHGGTYAEYLAVDAAMVRPSPKTLSDIDAAALPLVGVTAMISVADLAQVRQGQTVLVHGAGGGVGGAVVMIAKSLGARVVATCGTDKVDHVRTLGADTVIDYQKGDFREQLRDVDAVIDPIGGEVNLRSYEVLRRGGTLVVILRNDPIERANREALSAKYGVVVKEVAYDLRPDLLDRVAELADSGVLRANVHTVLPLAQAADAQRISEAGHARGKIVLTIG